MIDSYLLKYFIAFVEEGSLLKASEKLHISQPSLTRGMRKLEEELNLNLFDRSVNKITLNENGKELSGYIRDILSLNNLLVEKARQLKEKESIIRISMTAPGPMYFFPHFFFFASEKKYKVKIDNENGCLKEVLEGLTDIAFINENVEIEGLVCQKIMNEKLYVCLPENHFLTKKESISFAELDGQSFFLGKELGVWDNIVKEKLPNSKFFVMDQENIREVSKYSSIPSFQTNITYELCPREDKIIIPILDEEAIISFYVIYKPKNKKIFDMIQNRF